MYELYREKGMNREDAKEMSEILSRNREAWIDVMMVEELGLIFEDDDPWKNGVVTFLAFAIFGFVPILPYVVGEAANIDDNLFLVSTILTIIFMFLLGIIKSKFSHAKWYKSGAETLLIGAIAAGASYIIGYAFEGLIAEEAGETAV